MRKKEESCYGVLQMHEMMRRLNLVYNTGTIYLNTFVILVKIVSIPIEILVSWTVICECIFPLFVFIFLYIMKNLNILIHVYKSTFFLL